MDRNYLFENYITTHFDDNADLSDERRLRLENNSLDRNLAGILPQNKNIRILEIGFGTGFFLKYLLTKEFKNIYGIELSSEETEFVKKNVYKNIECVLNPEDFLERHKNEYDFIFMLDVLEHIPKEQTITFLKKVRASLKNEGIFIARVPNVSNPLNVTLFSADFTHEFFYSARSLAQVNRLAEFSDIKVLPFKEENLTWHGKITNITQKMMFPVIKLAIGLSRSYLDPASFYTKNIYCICKK